MEGWGALEELSSFVEGTMRATALQTSAGDHAEVYAINGDGSYDLKMPDGTILSEVTNSTRTKYVGGSWVTVERTGNTGGDWTIAGLSPDFSGGE